ncbi:MAG: CobW family GTP-binding protein [Arenicella sp.]
MIDKPVPLTIVGGFLGAGKTSLLRHILQADHGRKMAVLVNDFGQLNIDAELVVDVEGETVSLTNGCICCTIRDDLMREVLRLMDKPIEQRPEHIIIETSGVSDPTLVAHTFLLPAMQGVVTVDSIICLVDAEQILQQKTDYRALTHSQIRIADLLVINKVDLVPAEQLQIVRELVRKIAPQSRVLVAIQGQIPLNMVLDLRAEHPERLETVYENTPSLTPEFTSWSYCSDQKFSLIAIRRLVEDMPTGVYRMKGFIAIESLPDERAELQMTGGRAWLRLGRRSCGGKASTSLVFIGRKDEINSDLLNEYIRQYQHEFSLTALLAKAEPPKVKNLKALSVVFT